MAESRFCPHGNLRSACKQCKIEAIEHADVRAERNRERGEAMRQERMAEPIMHYPWQRDAFSAWRDGGRAGLVALSPGLPTDDLPWAVMAEVVNQSPSTNVLIVCAPDQVDNTRRVLEERFQRRVEGLPDHHFLEPRGDGTVLVADTEELPTADITTWGRFASDGLLLVLDADSVGPHLGAQIQAAPFPARFAVSRQPSAIDLLITRPWARGFGPLLYRATEDQARDWGVLPRIHYRLHVEMLRPEPEGEGPEGPWDAADIPTRVHAPPAGAFAKGRARDVATARAKQDAGLIVVHDGAPVREAAATVPLREVQDTYDPAPPGWFLADPGADATAVLRLATVAWKTLQAPGQVEDVVVLPVPKDLCQVPPWQEKWRAAAVQIDRVAAGLLLAEDIAAAMQEEDLESLVGVALALRGIPAEELHAFSPIVAEAAHAAHSGEQVPPQRVADVARSYGGLAAALLVGAELGPLPLLRLAHPRFTPITPDLPHPTLFDARAHAWRGRAFSALDKAVKHDLATTWGRYPELRFVFPSSTLLEAATAYCKRHKLKGPMERLDLSEVKVASRVLDGTEPELGPTKDAARAVLAEWNGALELAERQEREHLADMHARQPERERRREGVCLPSLAVVQSSGHHVVLETEGGRLPATNIAPGSEVGLVEQGERKILATGLVSRLTPRRVEVEFPHDAPPRHWPKRLTVNLLFDAKVFEAYHAAVLAAIRSIDSQDVKEDTPDGLLRACLLGDVPSGQQRPQPMDLPSLTDSQREAIEATLSGGRVHLVHGPPGTGKTHTLVHLAMALTRAGHSVLCTADSNAAVDNLVVGLRRMGAPVVRIAHAPNLRDEAAAPARIDPMDAPPFVRWAADQGIVVATTNYGAFRYIDPKGGLSPFTFDYVVHDEVGQSTAPSSLAAVMRGRRLVLAGDPLQLPPTVVSLDAKEAGLDVTLFERMEELTGKKRTKMLRTQFRMREEIVQFSNKRYYEGRIETDPAAAAQEGLEDFPHLAFQHVTGMENPRQRNGSISNNYEVDCIRHLLETIRPRAREKGWTMAILTPYQAQRELMRRALPDIEVSTVDGAQGREWDIVFYSSVRSNPRHRLGFLEDERRLNVAVTRARRHFILCGDERTLRSHDGFEQLIESGKKIRMFYPDQHGTAISKRGAVGRGAPKIGQEPPQKRGGRKRRRGRGGRGGDDRGGRGGDEGGDGRRAGREEQGGRAGRRGGQGPAPAAGGAAGPSDAEPEGGRKRRRRRGRRRRGASAEGGPPGDTSDASGEQGRKAPPAEQQKDEASRGSRDPKKDGPPKRGKRPASQKTAAGPKPADAAEGPKKSAKPAPAAKRSGRKASAPGEKAASSDRPKDAKAPKGAAKPKDAKSPKDAKAPKGAGKPKDAKSPKDAKAPKSAEKPKPAGRAAGGSGSCQATTKKGTPCRNPAKPGSRFCRLHG